MGYTAAVFEDLPLPVLFVALAVGGAVLVVSGTRLAHVVDRLADRTGLGEALAGALLLGAVTSLPGLVATIVGAAGGDAGFAVGNAMGGIAAQTSFLAIADLSYRRANLEHAAASQSNTLQAAVLVTLLGVVLLGTASPDWTVLGVHPATVLLVVGYVFGLSLVRREGDDPAWEPTQTDETRVDEPDPENEGAPLSRLWAEFAVLAVVVAGTGFVIANSGLAVAEETGITGTVVGTLGTGVITSLPELVTAIAAVRAGALTLAVGDIIGGNAFDLLMIAAADLTLRESVYHGMGGQATFVLALSIVLSAVLLAGLLFRQRKGIGFEGLTILGLYVGGMIVLPLV
ncbi:MAG: sodium:calcium antiporter [Actinomycetota bacterium]|nr:sodium:calcium antiporter [Actinomycetota bacterium]